MNESSVEFAKLFVIEGHQVLYWHEPHPEKDDRTLLHQMVYVGVVMADVKITLPDASFDEIWATFNQDTAKRVLEYVVGLMSGDAEEKVA